jgi:hypothetical protein
MRIATIAIFSLITALSSTAQQVNPVPDYVFGNRMSVGRTTVTDTSAYFSIGPRFNATRGMQPPMVGDTNAVTGTKRNGLLIFSMQRNRYAYWDSASSRWREFGAGSLTSITAGTGLTGGTITTSGTIAADTLTLSTRAWRQKGIDSVNANVALKVNISDTSSMLSPYIRAAGFGLTKSGQSLLVDSATMATRARVQKGIDSVAGLARVTGSGTTNYVPKFTSSTALGNSLIFDNGTNTGINNTNPVSGKLQITPTAGAAIYIDRLGSGNGNGQLWGTYIQNAPNTDVIILGQSSSTYTTGGGLGWLGNSNGFLYYPTEFRIGRGAASDPLLTLGNAELYVNTTSDAGAYALQVAGSIYNTTGAALAVNSGNLVVGAASTTRNFQVVTSGTNYWSVLAGASSEAGIIFGSSGADAKGRIIYQNGGEAMRIWTNSQERIRIDSSGNLGIATQVPTERLHVNGRARIATIDSAASPINLLWANVNGVIQKTAVASVIGSGTTNYIPKFATATTFDNSLIYQASSEVFINTTSDGGDFKLQVSGNTLVSDGQFRVNANANNGIVLSRSGTNSVVMYTSNTSGIMELGVAGATGGTGTGYTGYAGYLMTESAYPLQFGSVDTMRMTLNTSGELLISTSTTDNGNYRLQVDGNVWSTGSITTGDPTSGTKKPWKLGSVVGTTVQLDTGNYVEVEINGTFYRLALVTPL